MVTKCVCAAARSPLTMTELVTQLNAEAPVNELDVNEALQGVALCLDGRSKF